MLSDWGHVQESSVVQREQREYDVKKKHQKLFSQNAPSQTCDRILNTPLIVYKYCNCKDFVVYLSIILFSKITIDTVEAAIEMHLLMIVSVRDMLQSFPNWEKYYRGTQ